MGRANQLDEATTRHVGGTHCWYERLESIRTDGTGAEERGGVRTKTGRFWALFVRNSRSKLLSGCIQSPMGREYGGVDTSLSRDAVYPHAFVRGVTVICVLYVIMLTDLLWKSRHGRV